MRKSQLPSHEKHRLAALRSYHLLDTLPEKDFDNITSLAANICETPISLITLLDINSSFLKSHFGISLNESELDTSFCAHAISEENKIFIVEDARKDERFKNNPLVTEMEAIFYAGVPLINSEGYPLGTLCIFDTKPRTLTKQQKSAVEVFWYPLVL